VEQENAEALSLEAVLTVQPEISGAQRKDAEQQDRDGGKRWGQDAERSVAEERKWLVLLFRHWAEPPRIVVITKSYEP
jgi:hypothetical protein